MTAMNNAIRATETAMQLTTMNNGLRTSMDLMVRDLLQVGQGLPSGNVILIPSGAGSTAIKLPGRRRAYYLGQSGRSEALPAVDHRAGAGATALDLGRHARARARARSSTGPRPT